MITNEVWSDTPTYENTLPYRYGSPETTASFQFGQDYTLTNIGHSVLSNVVQSAIGDKVTPEQAKEIYGVDIKEETSREKVRYRAYHQYLQGEMNRSVSALAGKGGWSQLLGTLMGAALDPALIIGGSVVAKLGGVAGSSFQSFGKVWSALNKTKSSRFLTHGSIGAIANTAAGKGFFSYLGEGYGIAEASIDAGIGLLLGGGIRAFRAAKTITKQDPAAVHDLSQKVKVERTPEVNRVLNEPGIDNLQEPLSIQLKKLAEQSPSDFKMVQNDEFRNVMMTIMDSAVRDEDSLKVYQQLRYAVDNDIPINKIFKKLETPSFENLETPKIELLPRPTKADEIFDFGLSEAIEPLISLENQTEAVGKYGAYNYITAGLSSMKDTLEATLKGLDVEGADIIRKRASAVIIDDYIDKIDNLIQLESVEFDGVKALDDFNKLHKNVDATLAKWGKIEPDTAPLKKVITPIKEPEIDLPASGKYKFPNDPEYRGLVDRITDVRKSESIPKAQKAEILKRMAKQLKAFHEKVNNAKN